MEAVDWKFIRKFYLKDDVKKEILDYSKGRWIAIESYHRGSRIFIRHWPDGTPLEIKNEDYYKSLIIKFEKYKFRTIYATVNIYKEIKSNKLKDPDNIIATTPVFDIDGTLEDFEIIKNVAEIVVSELEKYGISKSVYLKWSGRGMHIHIHEKAFSEDIKKKYHPLDIAFAIVDYILKKKKEEIEKEIVKAKGKSRPFKVENKIDIQRVFTVPLSFHRFLDYVCICIKPNELNDFDLSWANPKNYKHNPKWREFEEGEGDELAEIAIREGKSYLSEFIKSYLKAKYTQTKIEKKEEKKVRGNIGRFQVMGLLQAARYYKLKGNLEKAKSFGLNRAIFYAWAKYYRPKYKISKKRWLQQTLGIKEKSLKYEDVGNERAFLSERGWFMIGDKEQTPEDFDKNIKEKIDSVIPFELAWEAALDYISKFPESVLEDQRLFYEKVYKPIRDNFIDIIMNYIKKKGIDIQKSKKRK